MSIETLIQSSVNNWPEATRALQQIQQILDGLASELYTRRSRIETVLMSTSGSGGTGVTDGDKGDITVTGSGAIWTIDNGVVTLAKMANIATDRLIGRDTAGTGVPEALTVGGNLEFTGSGGIRRAALTGDVTSPAGSSSTSIAANAVTNAKLNDAPGFSVIGRSINSTGDPGYIQGTANGQFLQILSNNIQWATIAATNITGLVKMESRISLFSSANPIAIL